MGFNGGFDGVIHVNSVDISAYTEKAEVEIKRADLQLPRLGGNPVARLVGPYMTDIKLEGWIDPALTAVLFPLATSDPPSLVPITYEPEGGGGDSRTGSGYVMDYTEQDDAKEAAKWTATIVVDGSWT